MSDNTRYKGVTAIMEIGKDCLLYEFQRVSGSPTIQFAPGGLEESAVPGHWLAVILLASGDFKLTLKTFYSSSSSLSFVKQKLGAFSLKLNQSLANDYIREYLNLVAGRIKRRLGPLGEGAGLSLPFVTRGFDELYSHNAVRTITMEGSWTIETSHGPLICKLELEAYDLSAFDALEWDQNMASLSDVSMEYL